MRLDDLVTGMYSAFDVPAALADVTTLCGHDRYQASAGIEAAAGYVADRARDAGLTDVDVLRLPTDGQARWWTFDGPHGWSPVRAELWVGGARLLRYPEQHHALAAYSEPTPPEGRPAALLTFSAVAGGADPAGAVIVLNHRDPPVPVVAEQLTGRNAVALVADPIAGLPGREPSQRGRIELPAGTGLAAFSATAGEMAQLRRAAHQGQAARVVVRVDTGACPPVVVARLAGRGDGEVLLSAHLCHPRPSANDNASGVAALLGVARAAATLPRLSGPSLRFVWGPEFVGMAAYLHDHVHTGRVPGPVAAVNVDMAGEDQHRCGGPLIVERVPDELPSYLSAVAERCVTLLPQAARSYTGAVDCDTWAWRVTPHSGGSDHALLVGPPTGCPTVGLGHWPDRANHTSADTPDKVDPAELRRTATVAGAALLAVRAAHGDPALAADLASTTVSWAAGHLLAAMPGAGPSGRPARPATGPVLDGWAEDQAPRLSAHRAEVAARSVRALTGLGVPPRAVEQAARWVDDLARLTRARLPVEPGPEPPPGRADPTVLVACQDGPANLRGLAARASAPDRAWISARLAEDRGGSYARMLALLRGVDGSRDRRALSWWAALASELPIPVAFADDFLDIACRSGWIGPADRDGDRR